MKTAELRREFDPVAEFSAERCCVDPDTEVEATPLRRAYEEWAKDRGAAPLNDREWGRRLKDMGCRRERKVRIGTKRTYWIGIGLLSDSYDSDTDQDPAQLEDIFEKEEIPF